MRRILITGASSGIGRAIADKLRAEGHFVVGLSRRPIADFPSLSLDLNKLDEIRPAIFSLNKKHGPFDTVIACAGKGHFGHLEQLSPAQVLELFNINILGHIFLIKTLLPDLKKQERSDIIFIGSEAALNGKRKGSIYCATKFAMRGFAQALRDECGTSSVKVSSIQPGMVHSPFYDNLGFEPEGGLLPEDVADTVSMILKMRQEAVLDEIRLSPKKHVVRFKKNS